jgi:hypothetical protein
MMEMELVHLQISVYVVLDILDLAAIFLFAMESMLLIVLLFVPDMEPV